MDRRPVDFSDVVRQLVDIYRPAMAERHHEVTIAQAHGGVASISGRPGGAAVIALSPPVHVLETELT